MKFSAILAVSVLLWSALLWPVKSRGEAGEPQGKRNRVSYSLGHQIGSDMKREGRTVDPHAFMQGLVDALDQSDPVIERKEMEAILVDLKRSVVFRKRGEKQEMMEQRFGEGEKFLAQNAGKEGVVVLPSGLQYRVIRSGTGRRPGPSDNVSIRYRSSLIDGTAFHDSTGGGEPEKFRVDGLIKGMSEALQLMREGARWEVFLPPEIAYGQRGLLANRTVVFDLELVAVDSPD